MDLEYWINLGKKYADFDNTETAFDAAKSDQAVWAAWNALDEGEQEQAADAFGDAVLEARRPNGQLIDIMKKHKIPFPAYVLEPGDLSLRAQQIASEINDAMTSGEVIVINSRGRHLDDMSATPLVREFLKGDGVAGYTLNDIGEYLYKNMPRMA